MGAWRGGRRYRAVMARVVGRWLEPRRLLGAAVAALVVLSLTPARHLAFAGGFGTLAQTLVAWRSLRVCLDDDPPPASRWPAIADGVLAALEEAHGAGIVHRDLKPQNIFLARSDLLGEVPKLLDFGVAHFVNEGLTSPGEVMGTPLYMALEQAEEGGRIGPWTDVFAAGIVLFECLAGVGERPWGSPNVLGYLARLKTRTPPRRLTDLAAGVSPELEAAIEQALSVDPTERYPDAARFARALEPFAQPRSSLFQGNSFAAAPKGRQTSSVESADTVIERRTAAASAIVATPSRPRTMTTVALQQLHRRLAQLGPERATRGGAEQLRPGERRYVTLLSLTMHI